MALMCSGHLSVKAVIPLYGALLRVLPVLRLRKPQQQTIQAFANWKEKAVPFKAPAAHAWQMPNETSKCRLNTLPNLTSSSSRPAAAPAGASPVVPALLSAAAAAAAPASIAAADRRRRHPLAPSPPLRKPSVPKGSQPFSFLHPACSPQAWAPRSGVMQFRAKDGGGGSSLVPPPAGSFSAAARRGTIRGRSRVRARVPSALRK